LDVDNDYDVTPLDALKVIDTINQRGFINLTAPRPAFQPLVDVNGDRSLSPLDALEVINALNSKFTNYSYPRNAAESEPYPIGFISIPLAKTPGQSGQKVPLASNLQLGREEFNEFGVFIADDETGSVNGIAPGQDGYADAVFQSATRQVLYSRLSVFRSSSSSDLPANAFAHAYVLQSVVGSGVPEDHLRVRQTSSETMRVGWEEYSQSVSGWQSVGDRGFDDATVELSLGTPISGNSSPIIASIPNRIINELSNLEVIASAEDLDLPDDTLFYSLEIAPDSAAIDPNTGRITWTPSEIDGPGNFEFQVRVTDRAGSFDSASFFVTVLEVNQSPTLNVSQTEAVEPGGTITVPLTATDPDLPTQTLTYSLLPGAPQGLTIDKITGELRWDVPGSQASGTYPVGVRVTDSGSPALSDTKTIAIQVGCDFDTNLSGWNVFESGGTITDKGTVTAMNCEATLREGNSFIVGLERTFTVPASPMAIEITYDSPNFDTLDTNFVRDAFEIALVDRDGNPLVAPFTPGRDAFLNVTEGMDRSLAAGVQANSNTITIGLNGIPVGTEATIIFRLTNDDDDTNSSVTINEFNFIDSRIFATLPALLRQSVRENANTAFAPESHPFNPASIFVSGPVKVEPLHNTWNDSALNSSGSFIYETSADFQNGQLFNLNTTDAVDQISLNRSGDLQALPIIWISNSAEGTVSKFDTRTGKEIGRYRTGAGGDDPSRIAVTRDGDAWVANRGGNNGVIKLLHDAFVDRNGNGIVDTSTDLNDDGVISANEIRPWDANGDGMPDDERIAFFREIGGGPRGVAVDANNKVWVSPYNGSGFRVFDNSTGVLEAIVNAPAGSYGAVIDGSGNLWSAGGHAGNFIMRFDTNSRTYMETIAVPSAYGITVDQQGVVWMAPWPSNVLSRYDPVLKEVTSYNIPATSGGGITVDRAGNLWFGTANSNRVWKFTFAEDRKTLLSSESVVVGNAPKSASIDADGYLWTVSLDDSTAYKIDTQTNTTVPGWPIATGARPYNYSDMTGDLLFTVTQREGTWTEIVDSSRLNAAWAGIDIVSRLPNETALSMRARTSNNRESLATQTWLDIQPNQPLPGIIGRFLEVETRLRSQSSDRHPTIDRITVHAAQPPQIIVSQPNAFLSRERGTFLFSGEALADRPLIDGKPFSNDIVLITVNNIPVQQLDTTGNFFTSVDVQPGINRYEVTAHDRYGQTGTYVAYIQGIEQAAIDFSRYSDITGSFSGAYFRTSFNEQADLLLVDLATRNDGRFTSDVPLLVGVKNISDPAVTLVGFDGVTPEGIPFYDYSRFVSGGRLGPGQLTQSPTVRFHNPNRIQFDYELVFYGKLNEAPYFTSVPKIEALAGRSYTYDADAADSDQDPLTFSLLVAPSGMSIHPNSGAITWTPTLQQIGQHDVAIQVSDSRGGIAEQRFTITAIEPPPNRPPVITSIPRSVATPVDIRSQLVFATDFDSGLPSGIAQGVATLVDVEGFKGIGNAKTAFQGKFLRSPTGNRITINLTDLPTHSHINLDFLFAAIDSLDGSGEVFPQGDYLKIAIDGDTFFFESFANATPSQVQSYSPPSGVELARRLNLGFQGPGGFYTDSAYYLGADPRFQRIKHSADTLTVSFEITGSGIQSLDDESWAIDNLRIETLDIDPPTYNYVVSAFDPDTDALLYSLTKSPLGMDIEPATGVVNWSPAVDQIGDHAVALRVTDGRGGIALQDFVICVNPDPTNNLPQIVSAPIEETFPGLYRYDVEAIDADSDELSYKLVDFPTGMTINSATGLVSWNTGSSNRSVPVRVLVSDQRGGVSEQAFTISISSGSGSISGTVFNDLDLDGYQDGINLVRNTDFENGLIDFRTTLVESVNLVPEGRFAIGTSPRNHHSLWADFGDHTSGTGKMMIVNGATNYDGFVWDQSIDVRAGNEYQFGLWAASAHPANPAKIQFFVDGAMIGQDLQLTSELGSWQYLSANWLADTTGTVRLSIKNFVAAFSGNDFVLDDIAFSTTDAKESGISDVVLYLDQNKNNNRDTGELFTNTDRNGSYSFSGLGEGTYYIASEPPKEWQQYFPFDDAPNTVSLSGNQEIQGVNFAYARKDGVVENSFPSINSTPVPAATANQLYRYNVDASDPDRDTIEFSLISAPDGMTVHPSIGAIVWVPRENQIGDNQVVVRVRDDRGGVALQAFTISVSLPNSAPVITSPSVSRTVAGRTFTHRLRAQDADLDELSFTLIGAPNQMTIEPVELRDANGQLLERFQQIRWDVPQSAVGTFAAFTVRVSDGRGGEATQPWALQLVSEDSANTAPVFASTPNMTARIGRSWTYLPVVNDPENDAITFSLLQNPENMTIMANGMITWTPPADAPSTVSVSIRATDNRGGQATQTFDLVVSTTEQNRTPVITSVPPSGALEEQMFQYNPVALDADHDPLTWSLSVAPRGMSIDPESGTIRWMPDDTQLGEHQVAVTVTDPLLGKFTQRFTLQVTCSNLPPAILSVPPTTALTTQLYFYAPRGVDPESQTLTWSLSTKPSGMTIDARTGVIRWTPTTAQTGTHEVSMEATDGNLVGRQSYRVVVSSIADDAKANRPPVITSTPVFTGEADSNYQYRVVAIDPDGDAVTYQLNTKPDGMTITTDGLIVWNPTESNAGDHIIGITATDARGAIATQGFLLSIKKNLPPVITSNPIDTTTAGSIYRYSVKASDPDSDPLSYSLTAAPDGMTIDSRGRILWNSPHSLTLPQLVNVSVSDTRGQTATQTYNITMLTDSVAPRVMLSISTSGQIFGNQGQVDVGTTYKVQVSATDNVGVTSIGLLVDGQPVTLTADNSITLTAGMIGTVNLLGFATDGAGLRGESIGTLSVVNPGQSNQPNPGDPTLPPHPGVDPTDQREPIVQITSPEIGTAIKNRVSIVGTVDDPENNLWYYRALFARADLVSITNIDLSDPDWEIFHQSTEEVVNGELAIFDASALPNDAYSIVIAGYDGNGRGYVAPTLVYVEGNLIVGNFHLEFTDLTIPLAGIPIQVSRVYDTLNAKDEGDFGYGWKLGIQDARIFEAAAIGEGGAFDGGNDKFVPDKTKVYLTTPSGERVGFTYKEQYQSGAAFLIGCSFGCFYRPYFVADPGVYDTLTIDETQVSRGGILGALSQGINPEYYTLTTKEGMSYRYHETRGLEKVTDRNGNNLSYSDSGIKHALGQEVQFVRDFRGRIKEIIDPSGQKLVYEYNAAGDLVRFTDQAGLSSRFEYLNKPAHYLDAVYDALGKRVLKAEYDADNRFVGIFDALGNKVDQRDFDTDNNRGIVRDGNGNPTTLLYDDRGNVLEEIDPQGNKTNRRYEDPRNPDLETTIIDRRGMVTERAYDAKGNLVSIKEKGPIDSPFNTPVATAFKYNSRNDVTSITNANGAMTVFDYDGQGNVVKITNALGNSSTFTYDSQGRRSSFTDFNGNKTIFDYHAGCACGAPSKVINADGTYITYKYNQFGQITLEQTFEANDTLVERKQTEYDSLGRVTRELIGGGSDPNHPPTDVRKFYNGQLLAWEIIVSPESLNVDGSLKESPATPVAQRKSRITEYRYDARDELITQIDAMGGVVDFRYDAQGNRVLLRDPVGNITTWVFDSLNRVAEERDPFYWIEFVQANSSLSTDALLSAVVEENKKPSTANLSANQGAPHVRSFSYDAAGNQTKIIDRNNRRREFSYDHAGRLLTEQWFAADNGPLVETITFTYDVLGNMKTAQNASSKYTYEYDQLNRVKSVDNLDTNPDTPRVILYYEYDAQGNLIKTSDDAGVTVQSTFSKRNQLETRKWFDAIVPVGGTKDVADARVDFGYTASGRQKQILRFSDLTATTKVGSTAYTYDLSGRTDKLIHKNAVDALLSSYDYNYDFSGLLTNEVRDHSDNAYDDNISYGYDLTGQLVDAAFSAQDDESYVYDLNGNRKSSVTGSETRTYTTAPANQLKSDGVFNYTYDGEGNQKLKIRISDGQVTENFWDHHNRLVKVEERSSGGIVLKIVEYHYDVMSRRIIEIVNGTVTLRVIHDWDHSWGDYNTAGTADTRYLFTNKIDQIAAAYRTKDGTIWYNADNLGTIRDLTDAAGSLQLTPIEYGAYGLVKATTDSPWNRFAFNGREHIEGTANYYYRSRVYAPEAGRFISRDTVGFGGYDFNLYRYVWNSPLNGRDPWGKAALVEFLLVLNSTALLVLSTDLGPDDSTGCGAEGLTANVPDSFFWGLLNLGPACQRHDKCYGTKGADKFACDMNFYYDLKAANAGPLAFFYWIGVFIGGQKAFDNAQDE
jgi:RHS repeat-associated protein